VIQLVDDQLLGSLLRGGSPPRQHSEVFTTGYWYVRLCQAVLGSGNYTGVLSAPFESLPPETRERAVRTVLELPDDIGLVSLRELAPLIGQLRRSYELNILSVEVLAAAVHLQADVFLSAPSPRLQEALQRESRGVELITDVSGGR
jgi:hypothetical protein